ncbi:hypothetical protein AB4K20DRAFT_1867367 [Rhizopus microsporus]
MGHFDIDLEFYAFVHMNVRVACKSKFDVPQFQEEVVQYIDEVPMPSDPHNHAVYTLKKISTKDIFRIVFGYTDYFDDKNIKRITAWCTITDHPSYYKTCMKSFEEEDLELIEYIRKSKGKEKKIMCESDC